MYLSEVDLSKYEDITYKINNSRLPKESLAYTLEGTKIYRISSFDFDGKIYVNVVIEYTSTLTNETHKLMSIINQEKMFYKKYQDVANSISNLPDKKEVSNMCDKIKTIPLDMAGEKQFKNKLINVLMGQVIEIEGLTRENENLRKDILI